MSVSGRSLVKPLMPVEIGGARIPYAQGMVAGHWLFATGHMAQDASGALMRDVETAGLPHGGLPQNQKEAEHIFTRIAEVCAAGGTDLEHIVRVDQYYAAYTAVDHYHVVRHRRLRAVPPSTSMIVQGLSTPGACINVQAVATLPAAGHAIEPIRDPAIDAHPTSGYPAALRCGDFVFLPGMTPSPKPGRPGRNGIAEEAQMPEGYLWRSTPIRLETEYIIREKILPALALAGSSAANMCKAQVYLVHPQDYAPFLQAWNAHFGASPCALSIIPCANPGIGQRNARLEINVLALRDGGTTRKEIVGDDIFTGFDGVPGGVRAGDLLFLSGLMAVDRDGLVAAARVDTRQPYLNSSIKQQTRDILARAQTICERGGTSLANIVRIQHFHTDLAELLPALEVWQERLPGIPLPFTAVQTPRVYAP
ncbi:MAG: RidA family protein [Rhizobiales bacterium]|nr:RidA family protein [Hyphomicrobiales bacterium]